MGNMLVGGVYGDLKEYGNQAIGCFCCLMLAGPILIIIGISLLVASTSDTRMDFINEYNGQVDTWNSDFGTFDQFALSSKLQVAFTLNKKTTTSTLTGTAAPEPLGDKSQRSKETFTKVEKPWYYTTKIDDKTINSVYIAPTLLNPQGSGPVSLDILKDGKSLTGSQPNVGPVTFEPVVTIDTKYRWYVSRSSSASSSAIDCRKRGYDYPGTRFRNVPYCDNWCAEKGGAWTDNGKCYASQTATATGCCAAYWGARSACVVVDVSGKVKLEGCATSYQTSSKTSSYLPSTMESYLGESLNDDVMKAEAIQYAKMGRRSDWGKGMTVSIRHEKDPYIWTSEKTKGCSSGTNVNPPLYNEDVAEPKDSAGCFGPTPEQQRSSGVMFLIFGGIMCVFPCGLIFWLKNRNKNNNSSNYNNNGYAANSPNIQHGNQPQQAHYVNQQPQQAQYVNQQPQMAPVQAQFVQPVQPMQPVQAQYVPQPQQQYVPQQQPVGYAQAMPVQAQYVNNK